MHLQPSDGFGKQMCLSKKLHISGLQWDLQNTKRGILLHWQNYIQDTFYFR